MDITATTEPRSDQQNFDDYGAGPKTVTIERVCAGSTEQPVEIHLVEYPGRPYKPSKSMRRVLVACWGPEASTYIGRRMRLYGDPSVKYGGIAVGGIKIGGLSHIDKRTTVALTVTRGKRAPHVVEPLPDTPAPPDTPPATPALTDSEIEAATTVPELRDMWPSATPAQQDRIKARVAALTEEPS